MRLLLFSFLPFLVLIHEVEFLIECARFPPLPIYDNSKKNNSKLRMDTHLIIREEKRRKSFESIVKKKVKKSLY